MKKKEQINTKTHNRTEMMLDEYVDACVLLTSLKPSAKHAWMGSHQVCRAKEEQHNWKQLGQRRVRGRHSVSYSQHLPRPAVFIRGSWPRDSCQVAHGVHRATRLRRLEARAETLSRWPHDWSHSLCRLHASTARRNISSRLATAFNASASDISSVTSGTVASSDSPHVFSDMSKGM